MTKTQVIRKTFHEKSGYEISIEVREDGSMWRVWRRSGYFMGQERLYAEN